MIVSNEHRFRASQIGAIMSYPNKDKLQNSHVKWIGKEVSKFILGWTEELNNFEVRKGTLVEDESIALFSSVYGDFFVKNTERKTNEFLTGECDIIESNIVWDIKSSYSKKTHEMFFDISDNSLYKWQLVSYSELFNVSHAGLARCLVDTPHNLISPRDNSDWHIVSHIEPHKRCSYQAMEITQEMREQLMSRAKLAQEKFNEMLAEKM